MTKPVPNGTADRVGVSNHAETAGRHETFARSGRYRSPQIEPLMSTRDVAEMTGEREQTVRVRRMRGDGPPYVRVGSRAYYHPEDVREWLRGRRFQSTSEETVAREAEARSVAKERRGRRGAK